MNTAPENKNFIQENFSFSKEKPTNVLKRSKFIMPSISLLKSASAKSKNKDINPTGLLLHLLLFEKNFIRFWS